MNPDDLPEFRDTEERLAAQRPMGHTPGEMEDKETAAARANRTDQTDTTSQRPDGALHRGGASTNHPEEQPPEQDRETRPAEQPSGRPTQPQPGLGPAADPFR